MNYREEILRTCPNFGNESFSHKLTLGALGVAGEAGEVADLLKKVLFHGKPLDRAKLIKEMGDVYWYLEYLGATIDVTRDEVMAANIEKLRARFPNGFSHEAANARADEVIS